jgi:hypothetical protein
MISEQNIYWLYCNYIATDHELKIRRNLFFIFGIEQYH